MKLKKYIAPDTRTALLQIREELGSDAIIYSNRRISQGVEIIASIEELDQTQKTATSPQSEDKPSNQTRTRSSKSNDKQVYSEYLETPQESALKALQGEFKSLKNLVQEQLSNLVWDKTQRISPNQALLMRHLLHRGFPSSIVKQIIHSVNDEQSEEQMLNAVYDLIYTTLSVQKERFSPIKGRVLFVGAPGVGKTLSLTKMAAQLALKHGPDHLAIFTLDNKRIGAYEEISIYGKICNIPVYRIENQQSYQEAIKACHQFQTIFIDTPGLSPYDQRQIEQLYQMIAFAKPETTLLACPANVQSDCLMDTIQSFQRFDVDAAIVTKVDEVKQYGTVLGALMAKKCQVLAVSSGNKIPDDLVSFEHSQLVCDALYRDQTRAEHLSDDTLARMISEVELNEL